MVYKTKIEEIQYTEIDFNSNYGMNEYNRYYIKSSDKKILDIREHKPTFSGERHYYEVIYKNNKIHRIYNADYVIIERKEIKSDVSNDFLDGLV